MTIQIYLTFAYANMLGWKIIDLVQIEIQCSLPYCVISVLVQPVIQGLIVNG